MGTITTTDGTETYYKGWGAGQPIVFRHGWPLSADDWDTQMLYFLRRGYRVIAHDRRGHGRSTQTADGHDVYHYADDLAALTTYLDLHDTIHVGHSTGGGEVAHYIARHGENRVAKAVLISANASAHGADHSIPGGLPKSQFDGMQAQLAANRSVFLPQPGRRTVLRIQPARRGILRSDHPELVAPRNDGWLSLPLFDLAESIAAYHWDLDEIRELLLAESAAMKPEVAALHELDSPAEAA